MIELATSPVSESGIQRIVIVGSGFEAWLAANHLLAGLGRKRVEVTVCPVDGSDSLDALYSVIPAGPEDGLSNIGLSSPVLARSCSASFSLGTRVGEKFKPYGKVGVDFLGLPFHHHYSRARDCGDTSGFFDWSPATMAMRNDRFAPPVTRSEIGTLKHGMAHHIDIPLLTRLLRERVTRHGVKMTSGSLASVSRCNVTGRITRLVSEQGEIADADLYLDCSGPARALTRDAANHAWVSFPASPEYAIHFDRQKSDGYPPPYHRVTADADGWRLEIPGAGWVTQIILSTSTGSDIGQPFTPGYLLQSWSGNCLSLGGAAATILPVEPIHAKVLILSLKRLLSLLPGRDCATSETAEYNHLDRVESEQIEDLTSLYELARSADGLSLDGHDLALDGTRLSKSISLFRKRGWITPGDGELLQPSDWVAAFMLLDLKPVQHDRLAERLPVETLRSNLQKLKAQINKVASEFPTHRQYLDAVKSTAAAARQKNQGLDQQQTDKSREGQYEP